VYVTCLKDLKFETQADEASPVHGEVLQSVKDLYTTGRHSLVGDGHSDTLARSLKFKVCRLLLGLLEGGFIPGAMFRESKYPVLNGRFSKRLFSQ
jgi:hypothetical protein